MAQLPKATGPGPSQEGDSRAGAHVPQHEGSLKKSLVPGLELESMRYLVIEGYKLKE